MRSFIFSLDALLAFLVLSSFTRIFNYLAVANPASYAYEQTLLTALAHAEFLVSHPIVDNRLQSTFDYTIPTRYDYALYINGKPLVGRHQKSYYQAAVNLTVPLINYTPASPAPQPFQGVGCGCTNCWGTPCSERFAEYTPPTAEIVLAKLEVDA